MQKRDRQLERFSAIPSPSPLNTPRSQEPVTSPINLLNNRTSHQNSTTANNEINHNKVNKSIKEDTSTIEHRMPNSEIAALILDSSNVSSPSKLIGSGKNENEKPGGMHSNDISISASVIFGDHEDNCNPGLTHSTENNR